MPDKSVLYSKIDNAMEDCCITILEYLEELNIKLEPSEVFHFTNEFFRKLDHQNNKVIIRNIPDEGSATFD